MLILVLGSAEMFVGVLESPGIWTSRSIFLIISIPELSRYTLITTTDYTLLTYSVSVNSMSFHYSTAFIENVCILSCI